MKHQRGFTLVELSIVIVIIGLIAAGITSGISILRESQLKRLISDSEYQKGLIALFKNRYNALPGDFAKAGTIWGNDCNGSSSGSDECSGNGNRVIEHGSQDDLSSTSESLRLWQHLSNADMASGGLTGLPNSSCSSADNVCAEAGVNIPSASFGNSGYYFYTDSALRATALFVGANLDNSWNSNPIISPLEAYEIDKKTDDGVNHTGKFSGAGLPNGSGGWALNFQDATSNCYNASSNTGYNTSSDNRSCGAVFIIGIGL